MGPTLTQPGLAWPTSEAPSQRGGSGGPESTHQGLGRILLPRPVSGHGGLHLLKGELWSHTPKDKEARSNSLGHQDSIPPEGNLPTGPRAPPVL